MKKVIIIVRIKSPNASINFAVWNALKLHIEYMLDSSYPVFYTKDKESVDLIKKHYNNFPVFKYKNIFSLLYHIHKMWKDCQYIWVPDIIAAWKAVLIKILLKKEIIFWSQGIIPEESYMRNKSNFRFYLLNLMEKYALKAANKHVFVSETMKSFYEDKYKIKFREYIIVPCLSSFNNNEKIQRKKNSFVYLGGLSTWQCFDKVLVIYRRIWEIMPETQLHIITSEILKAKNEVFAQFQDISTIQIYEVKDRSLLSEILSNFEYGFLIREDNPVNRVASPIKFAEYLSCGVNVIMTESIPHLSKLIKFHNAGIILDETLQLDNSDIFKYNKNGALGAYQEYFSYEKQSLKYSTLF